MKKLLVMFLTIILIVPVFAVPSMAEDLPIATVPATGDVLSDYYVNETCYFRYRIGSFRNGLNEGRPYREGPDYENDNLLSDKALIIYGFSEGFLGLEEFVVPDEINGEKIENVIIKDYQPLKRVVLSDGIQKFACYMDSEEDGEWEIPREENPIESLHLGKDFLLDSMSYLKTTQGRLENLESITVSEENPYLNTHGGAVYSEDYETFVYCPPRLDKKTFTLKSGTKVIGAGAFANSRFIQSIKRIQQVEKIGSEAFRGTKKIKKIVIGDKIKEISYRAFYNSSVERITLGKNVEAIGSYAFEKSSIKSIVLGGKVKEIGYRAFYKSDIEQATIGKKIKKLGMSTFAHSKLKKITLKGKIKIGKNDSPFYGCKQVSIYANNKSSAKYLKKHFNKVISKYDVKRVKIYIGNKLYGDTKTEIKKMVIYDVQEIESYEYRYTDITEVVIDGNVKTVGGGAFQNSSLQKATIGKNVEVIGANAFYNSNLKEITINGKTTIGSWAFQNSKIKKVTVNAKIKLDKKYPSFSGCEDVEFYAKNKEIAKSLYNQLKQNNITSCKIFVGNKELYSIKPEF